MARQRSCAMRGVLGWWAGGTAAQRTTPWGTSCALHQTLAATQPSSTAHRIWPSSRQASAGYAEIPDGKANMDPSSMGTPAWQSYGVICRLGLA